METKDIMRSIAETKDVIRRVRTPAGVRRFGQPIGSIIVPNVPTPRAPRKGTRRARSMEADARAERTTRSRQKRTQNRPERIREVEARVAPEGESLGLPEEVTNRGIKPGSKAPTKPSDIPRYESEAPFRDKVDFNFMKNGTVAQAQAVMKRIGVKYKTTPTFKKKMGAEAYRDFIVGVAESARLMEEAFPGWAKRHGRIYTEARDIDSTAYNFPYVDRPEVGEDSQKLSDAKRGRPHEVFFQGNVGLGENSSYQNQTATVFSTTTPHAPDAYLRPDNPRLRSQSLNGVHAYFSGAEGSEFLTEGSNERVAQTMKVALHEFGHSVAETVSGDISHNHNNTRSGGDGQWDANAYHRRWYKQYYHDAQLKFLESHGVIDRTDKPVPDFDYLMHQARADQIVAEGEPSAERMERYREEVEKARKSAKEDASPFTYGKRAQSIRAYLALLQRHGYIDGFDLNAWNTIAPSLYGSTMIVEMEAESFISYLFDRSATTAATEWGATLFNMMQWFSDDDTDPNFEDNARENG